MRRALFFLALFFVTPSHAFALRGRDAAVLIGPNIGWVGHDTGGPGAGLLGLEVSWARLDWATLSWTGVYADVVHDFHADQTRVSLGPELGVLFFGIDAGPLLARGPDGTEAGFRGRLLASIPMTTIYVGSGISGSSFVEAGVLLKLPIQTD